MTRRLSIAAVLLAVAVSQSASAFPIFMDPVVTEPAPGFPLRLSLLSTDTAEGPLRFRLEPVSGAWDAVKNDGFYHFYPRSIDAILGGSTSFVQLSLGCGPLGCFNGLHLGAGGIDPMQPVYVDFTSGILTTPNVLPLVLNITDSRNLVVGGLAFAEAAIVPEPSAAVLLAIGIAALARRTPRSAP